MRLTVYGFLSFDETVLTLTQLSKREREELLKSQIARENKTFVLALDHTNMPESLQNASRLTKFFKRIESRVMLADKLELVIKEDLDIDDTRSLGKELALLVQRLPERFDRKKISLFAPEVDL